MIAQLQGKEPSSQMVTPPNHALETRKKLSESLFHVTTDKAFGELVETMSHLCLQSEERRSKLDSDNTLHDSSAQLPRCAELSTEKDASIPRSIVAVKSAGTISSLSSTTATRLQKSGKRESLPPSGVNRRLTALTCLFCYGKPGRKYKFARPDILRRHYRTNHFQYQMNSFICPLVGCEDIIMDSDQYSSHATRKHGSNLGKTASIMEVKQRAVKPGNIITFVA